MTEETLLSTPTSLDLNSAATMVVPPIVVPQSFGAHEMVPVNVNTGKIPEVLEGAVMTGVYTLPEEPEVEENCAEANTEM